MSNYVRNTRECSVEDLHPEIFQAIQRYFQEHAVGDLQSDIAMCCETISRTKNTGKTVSWLDDRPDTTIYTGMLLTSQWLIWAHHGDRSGTQVHAASLNEIQAEFHTPLLTKDAGLKIVGYVRDDNTLIRGHIAMGKEPDAEKFCKEVNEAIRKANPSAHKGFFRWLGGF